MTPEFYLRAAVVPALSLFPMDMDTANARAMMVAIPLQESSLKFRKQLENGPARGYPQFELGLDGAGRAVGGLSLLLKHAVAGPLCARVVDALDYADLTPRELHGAMTHNDVLAAAMTRALLLTFPGPLPGPQEPEEGWHQYLSCWRPGKPHPEKWLGCYRLAWDTVA